MQINLEPWRKITGVTWVGTRGCGQWTQTGQRDIPCCITSAIKAGVKEEEGHVHSDGVCSPKKALCKISPVFFEVGSSA